MMKAVEAGQTIGLANKESLVSAGHVISHAAEKHGARLIPLDSEHSAIFQCWHGWQERLDGKNINQDMSSILRICLTASGGPFLSRPLDEFASIKPIDAVTHPNWEMGRKISVDSASMMNKGLEVIEAGKNKLVVLEFDFVSKNIVYYCLSAHSHPLLHCSHFAIL